MRSTRCSTSAPPSPRSSPPTPTSRLWSEENERAWAQHDPELANKLLDEIGLQWDSSGNFRLGPGDKPITFQLEIPAWPVFLLGADRLGRDVLSRVIYGARISLSIGLVGVAISFVLGCLFGGGLLVLRRRRRSGRRCGSSS